ncbi:hypothetical protein [Kitasatospora sp. NPDC059599]|uniref:hypothetical protein n=1 Tax=Kitasatospora sp. NPDC059599 TaxID=3346880 RepID=UPI0036B20513
MSETTPNSKGPVQIQVRPEMTANPDLTPGTGAAAPDPQAAAALEAEVRDKLLAAIGAEAARVAQKPAGEAAAALAGLARAYARVVGGRRAVVTTETDGEVKQDSTVVTVELPPAAAQARMELVTAIEGEREGWSRREQEPGGESLEFLLDLADAYGTVTRPPLDDDVRDTGGVYLRLSDASGKFM